MYKSRQRYRDALRFDRQCKRCAAVSITPEVEAYIVAAHSDGLGDREIERLVGVTHGVVAGALNRHGLTTNNPRRSVSAEERRAQKRGYRLASLDAFFSDKVVRTRARSRQQGVRFDLDVEHLAALWERQLGQCFYTDAELDIRAGVDDRFAAVSIDRLIPEDGYVKGNVVLCTLRINTMKSNVTLDEMREWMPGWYARVQEFLAA